MFIGFTYFKLFEQLSIDILTEIIPETALMGIKIILEVFFCFIKISPCFKQVLISSGVKIYWI